MKKLSNKKINKTFRDNLITYGMVIAAYVIMQILVSAGSVSSLIQGLLVPLCTYAILAVSLNLTVGILGELSLGHAGFLKFPQKNCRIRHIQICLANKTVLTSQNIPHSIQ